MLLYYTGLSLSWQYIEFQSLLRQSIFNDLLLSKYCKNSNKRLGKTSEVEYAPKISKVKYSPTYLKSCEEALIWKLWCYLKVFVGYWKVIWCYLVLFSVTKKFFKKSDAKVTGLLHKPACKKLNKRLFLLRAPVKKVEYLISSRGGYSNFFSTVYNWNKKENHLLCQTTQ